MSRDAVMATGRGDLEQRSELLELLELLKRVKRLEMEREIPKRTTPVFAKESR